MSQCTWKNKNPGGYNIQEYILIPSCSKLGSSRLPLWKGLRNQICTCSVKANDAVPSLSAIWFHSAQWVRGTEMPLSASTPHLHWQPLLGCSPAPDKHVNVDLPGAKCIQHFPNDCNSNEHARRRTEVLKESTGVRCKRATSGRQRAWKPTSSGVCWW